MEFPYITAQVTAAQYYKASCGNVTNQQAKENLCTESEQQDCNEKTKTEQNEVQSSTAENNDKQGITCNRNKQAENTFGVVVPNGAEKEKESTLTLPFIKSLDDKKSFLECPFYEVQLNTSADTIRIPLEVSPRLGMLKTELLLFTNGRKTVIFDPNTRRYYSGVKNGENGKADLPSNSDEKLSFGEDPTMPLTKSAEVYSTQNEEIYLIGGLEVDKSSSTPILRSRVFTFDTENFSWKPCRALDEPRCMMGMGELDGMFVVTGGKALASGNILSLVQMYDQEKDTWWKSTSLPSAVYGHQCASVKQKLFVMGGKTNQREIQNSVYFLHAKTHQWTTSACMNVPRFLAGVTVLRSQNPGKTLLQREEIFVVGGVGGDGILSSVECYNTNTDERWKFKEDFPGNRCAQTLTTINGQVYAIGGHVTERNDEGRYESIQKYDVFALEASGDVTAEERRWRQTVRHSRGVFGTSCACVGIRVNKTKLHPVFL